MDTKTALKESIAHWKRLEAVKTPEEADEEGWGGSSCPLCLLYNGGFTAKDGVGICKNTCPVKGKTGKNLCKLTPYKSAADALTDYVFGGELDLAPITKMREFLETL